MKNLIQFTLIYALLTTTGLARGEKTLSYAPHSTDTTILRQYFSRFVREVQQPFYLYHWRSNQDLASSLDVQSNPQKYGHKIVEAEAPAFIPGLYVNGRTKSSAYGGGLYAALDPAATEMFGSGAPDSWAVLVMHLPVGFKMLDLRTPDPNLTSAQKQELTQALSNVNCPDFSDYSYLNNLLQMDTLSQSCADMLKDFLTTSKVDGLLYPYYSSDFKICQPDTNRGMAVVFTSSGWLNKAGAEARLYTSHTTPDLEERRVIESAFLYTYTIHSLGDKSGMILWSLSSKFLKEKYAAEYGAYNAGNSTYSCASISECTLDYKLIYSEGTINAKIRTKDFDAILLPSYPAHFSKTDAKGPDHLHWSDLISLETVKNPENWLQENIFECGHANFLASPHEGPL